VFENRVLRILGLHNEELHSLFSSPNIIRMIKSRRMRWAGHVARMGETRNAYRILVGKREGKRPLGRPRHWWVQRIFGSLLIIIASLQVLGYACNIKKNLGLK
jgi:hypothetical protein